MVLLRDMFTVFTKENKKGVAFMSKKEMPTVNQIVCRWTVDFYDERYPIGDYSLPKVAIGIDVEPEEFKSIVELGKYHPNVCIMHQKQYDTIFAPLFEEIRTLNAKIKEQNEWLKNNK